MDLTYFFFTLFGIIAIATAVGTVFMKNPVASAVSLVAHFFMLAGIYLTLHAQFVAVMQILVYAGAIMVLVIFVIMLLNLGNEEALKQKFDIKKLAGMAFGFVFVLQVVAAVLGSGTYQNNVPATAVANATVEGIGKELFSTYLFAFEAISLLLIVAVIGALVLAKKRMVK